MNMILIRRRGCMGSGGNRIYEAYEGASGDGGTPLRPENDSGSPIGCVQLRPVVCGGKR